MDEIKFLTRKKYSSPYTEEDLKDAIKLGKEIMLERVKWLMVGMVVNGTMQSVLTEQKLKDLTNETN
jgi:uncharacterized membrane protein YraQ (UPF0718 family)